MVNNFIQKAASAGQASLLTKSVRNMRIHSMIFKVMPQYFPALLKLLSMAIIIGPWWTNVCSQKLKKRILAIFGFNRTTLSATQPKLHSMFCALFLKIVLSAADVVWPPRSCDLTPLDYSLWGAVKDKCYTGKPETIDDLKDNIREAILMCLKIGPIV